VNQKQKSHGANNDMKGNIPTLFQMHHSESQDELPAAAGQAQQHIN
jgi:hypothetical protein